MVDVHLTGLAPSKARTLRGIRAALLLLGQPNGLDVAASILAVREALQDTDDPSAVIARLVTAEDGHKAVALLQEYGCDGEVRTSAPAALADEPEPKTNLDEFTASGEQPSYEAVQASMILLHVCEGNPGAALQIARAFKRILGHDAWDEVADALIEAFPPKRVF